MCRRVVSRTCEGRETAAWFPKWPSSPFRRLEDCAYVQGGKHGTEAIEWFAGIVLLEVGAFSRPC